ncbi:MAG TPA: CDP-alcohol phosphatidyltransferase family protein [Candidatus Saccharimonadales bacterium]|nr:CDP-alcohol phosphatidyltransferase family protein [Candidatus Saccharimonadales bacterium]
MFKDRNLHLVGKQAEYELVPAKNRTSLQRLAVRTHGIVTPANAVTLTGFGLVMSGLYDIYNSDLKKGTKKMFLGRACDLVDGFVAHATHTKSPTGEALDVTVDKLELVAAGFMLKKLGYVPDLALKTIAAREATLWGLTAVAKYRGVESHASEESKRYTFVEWASIVGGYLPSAAAAETDHPMLSEVFRQAGSIALLAHTKAGLEGIGNLAEQAFAPIPSTDYNSQAALESV